MIIRSVFEEGMEEKSSTSRPKVLVPKHELVRLIIQCLYSLGYTKSASILEIESNIRQKSAELELLELQILNGKWDECINTLSSCKFLMEDARNSSLFLVFKQWLLEYLHQGDLISALTILRKRVLKLGVSKEKIQNLAGVFLSLNEIELDGAEEISIHDLRRQLLSELEKLLPPPIAIPERRLEYLVETIATSQIDRCVYHNEPASVSLYRDHCCDRYQIPTETIQILTDHKNEVWFVQFSHDGEYLASSSRDGTTIIWKVQESGNLVMLRTLQGHQNPVSFIAWSPDDKKLLTCGIAEVLRLWDMETGTCCQTYGDSSFIVSSCAWFPDSKHLVGGSSHSERGICIWDCDGNNIHAWTGMRLPKILDLALTPDGENLICVLSERDIRVVNLVTKTERVISEENPISTLSLSADGSFFIVNLNTQDIHMWDVAGNMKKPLRFFGQRQGNYVLRSCFGGLNNVLRSCFGGLNSGFIASGSEDSRIYIWNRRSKKLIEVLCGHTKTVSCVSWNPRRPKMLASASDDQTVRIWVSCVGNSNK